MTLPEDVAAALTADPSTTAPPSLRMTLSKKKAQSVSIKKEAEPPLKRKQVKESRSHHYGKESRSATMLLWLRMTGRSVSGI
jgi:hypothetical protein